MPAELGNTLPGEAADNTWLLELAVAVADRRDPDWDQATTRSGSEKEREIVDALAVIAQIAHHRRQQTPSAEIEASATSPDVALTTEPRNLKRWREFELLELLGEGGFAKVYRAWDPQLDREVALKLLHTGRASSMSVELALREARLLARVRHANVASVYGADEDEGSVGFWMELVRGQTLSQWLRAQGPLGAREAALLGIDLCGALAAAHQQGVVHRDLKAENVMREEGGRILLVDFGIGKLLAGEPETHRLSGTPLYLAPEALAGAPLTPQVDLYSLGVLLFHLATGRFPIEGDSLTEIREWHRSGRRNHLRDLRPDLPLPFVAAVEKALEASPKDRFETAATFERALARVLERDERRAPRAQKPSERRRRVTRIALAVVGVLLIASIASDLWLRARLGASLSSYRHYKQAIEAYEEDRTQLSLSLLDQAIRTSPRFAVAHLRRSVCLTALNRHAEALESAEVALRLAPDVDPRLGSLIEQNYYQLRLDYEFAIQSLRAAPGNYSDAFAQRQLATLFSRMGRLADALRSIDRALELDPESFQNLGRKLILLVEDEQPDQALELFEKHERRISPQRGGYYLYWGAGLARLHRGEMEEAKRLFEQMEEGGGTYAENAQLLQARRLMLTGDLEATLELLESNTARIPSRVRHADHSSQAYWRAWIHHLLNQPDSAAIALEEMQRHLDLEAPVHARKVRDAALLHLQLGNPEGAVELLEALEEQPDSALVRAFRFQIRGELAWLEGDESLTSEALKSARQFHEDGHILWSLATHYQRLGELEQEARVLETLVGKKGQLLRHDELILLWLLARARLVEIRLGLGQDLADSGAEVAGEIWAHLLRGLQQNDGPPIPSDLDPPPGL